MTVIESSLERNRIIVQEVTQATCAEWDAFVRQAACGLPLHLSGWRQVMRDTYGYRTHYLMAHDDEDEILGVLPLFIVPSRLTGKRATTMPGGLCAISEQAASRLIDQAVQIANAEGIGAVVIQDAREIWAPGWHVESGHVYWTLSLPDTEESLWSRLDGNIRRQVRKGKKNGLRVEIDRNGRLLEPYYEIFSRFTHLAGTPVFSLEFLKNIIQTFAGGFNIALVWNEATPIAGYLQLEMNDTVYGMWGAALPETLILRPAYLALWEIMRDAIANKYSHLDMGRSPAGSNASKFKGQWGGISAPIYQLILRENGQRANGAVANQVQSDQRFQLFQQLWPRLPYSVTRRLGPKLRWHIPFA